MVRYNAQDPGPTVEVGCHIDGRWGHFVTLNVVELAQDFGFIVDPFAQYAIDRYNLDVSTDGYPFDALVELSDEAIAWLNSSAEVREVNGQNLPPVRPAGALWAFNEGDFGLYTADDCE